MNTEIEFHDSTLLSVSATGERVLVRLKAYVHRRSAIAGKPGTGWSQEIAVEFASGAIETLPNEIPVQLWEGQLGDSDNLVPFPLRLSEPTTLKLETCSGEWLRVTGSGLQVYALGEATYVEELLTD
jgi:hypothetical protein